MISVLCVVKMLNPTCCVKLIIIKISDEDFRAGSTWVRGPESIWYAWLALTPITISKMFYLYSGARQETCIENSWPTNSFHYYCCRTNVSPSMGIFETSRAEVSRGLPEARRLQPASLPARKLLKLKHKQPKLLTRNDPGCNSCLFKVLC